MAARAPILAVYTGLLMVAWSIAEARTAEALAGENARVALIVGLWGMAWFLSYRYTMPLVARAHGRRRVVLHSLGLGLLGLALLEDAGTWYYYLASYISLSTATAMAVTVSTASLYREEYSEAWTRGIVLFKIMSGVVQAIILALVLFTGAYNYVTALPLSMLLAFTALLAYHRMRDPLIPPTIDRLVDRIHQATSGAGVANPSWTSIARLGVLVAVLSVTKFLVLPEALREGFYAGLTVYASTLSLGAIAAARIRSSRAASIISLASLALAYATGDPLTRLALISLATGYADATLILYILDARPSFAPIATYTSITSLALTSMGVAIASALGVLDPFLAAIIASGLTLVLFRRKAPWYAYW